MEAEWSEQNRALLGRVIRLDLVGSPGAIGKVCDFNEENRTFTIDTMVWLAPHAEDLLTVSETELLSMLEEEDPIVVEQYTSLPLSTKKWDTHNEAFVGRVQTASPQPLARPTKSRIPLAPFEGGYTEMLARLEITGKSHSAGALGRLATLYAWKDEASAYIRRCNTIDLAASENLKALDQTPLAELRRLCAKYKLSSKGLKTEVVARLSASGIGGRAHQQYRLFQYILDLPRSNSFSKLIGTDSIRTRIMRFLCSDFELALLRAHPPH